MNAGGGGGFGDMPDFGAGPSGSASTEQGDENADDSDDEGPPPLEDAEPAK
jgi:hypothetical protein